ncbi:HAMP domain-containing sensor histidine kinase [Leeuwenhoekiella marinoflava]|uniref:sensor histidine kinase n=1 Tax=Leeuwenhoekiella marinoflava TaxID=988 RepID=UPI0030026CBE
MNTQDYKRAKALAKLDLDYHELKSDFQALSILAAKVAGTELSEVNFIDNYTQWTVAGSSGIFNQKPREQAICNFTIEEADHFKIRLDLDENFKETDYVKIDGYKLYYGIPLKLNDEIAIGSLCVAGKAVEDLSESQVEQLHLIAKQIEKQILLKQDLLITKKEALEERKLKRRLAHDVRSPISGIAQLIDHSNYTKDDSEELLKVVNLISASSKSILQLVEDILIEETNSHTPTYDPGSFFTLERLTQKLVDLYNPQAQAKNIELQFDYSPSKLKFSRNYLLPMIGNLISNSIKFTEPEGQVFLKLAIQNNANFKTLNVEVSDTGIGMDAKQIDDLFNKQAIHREGTSGEQGYGMGLVFVKQLCEELEGTLTIESRLHEGTSIKLNIPLEQ